MGSFLGDIGKALGIGGQTTPGVTPVPPMAGDPSLSTIYGDSPSGLIAALGDPSALTRQPRPGEPMPGGMGDDVAAVIKGFKPKKINFFQALGDQLLMHWGNKPVFQQRVNDKNMREAMEGFTSDPVQAVRRIAQVNPELAWTLLDKIQDNKRADSAQERLLGKDQDSVLKNAAGIMGVALRNPQNRSAAIQRYNQILRSRGLEDHILSDDVDDAVLESIYYGAMPPNQQEQAEYRKTRLEQQDRGLDIRERNTDSQIERREDQTRQSDERITIARDKAKGAGGVGGRVYKDPNGSLVEFNKDGNNMKVTSPDGNTIGLYKKDLNGRPVLVRQMTKEEYEAATKKGK
jgi:hypothetical protein